LLPTESEERMYRGAGTGLIALGIVLVVIGAILKWAVNVTTTGFNINAVGVILFVAGIVSALMGIALFTLGANRRAISRESVQYTPTGRERVMERRDVMPGPCSTSRGAFNAGLT
jgi:Domain of unknown function (DUF6458)